jgi:hypothetical protein
MIGMIEAILHAIHAPTPRVVAAAREVQWGKVISMTLPYD